MFLIACSAAVTNICGCFASVNCGPQTAVPRVVGEYRKIPKIIPGLIIEGPIFGGAFIRRGLSTESYSWK